MGRIQPNVDSALGGRNGALMINITVGNNEVEIEGTKYHSFNDKDILAAMVRDIIERCLYSGESLILYKEIDKNRQVLIDEWVNPHVSSRYNRRSDAV